MWDPTAEVAGRLAQIGAMIAATPEEAGREADVAITMVPTITAIEEFMPQTLRVLP